MTEIGKTKRRIKTVWLFAKPYTVLFIIAEICILISYGVALLLPLNLAMLTDKVLYLKNKELLNEVVINYIVLLVISISNVVKKTI